MRRWLHLNARILPFVLLLASTIGSKNLLAGGENPPSEKERDGIVWASGFEAALEEAQIDGKLVMVDFFTDWCGWCRRLDADTYANPEVAAHARGFVCVKVNAERRTDVARRYAVRAYPSIAFLHPDGSLVDMVRGYLPPRQFVPVLDRISDSAGERFSLIQRLKDHPDLVDLRYDLARALIRAGDEAAALAEFDTCLMAENGLEEGHRWDLRLDRARLLVSLGQPHDARKDLKGYVDRRRDSSRHAEAIYFYAEACLADGDKKEARKFYRKLLAEKPQGWLADRSRLRLGELG